MENSTVEKDYSPALIALALVGIVTAGLLALAFWPRAEAAPEAELPPAAIEVSVKRLQQITPEIKKLEIEKKAAIAAFDAKLKPYREEQTKLEDTLKVWDYGFDYDKLVPVAFPKGQRPL